MQINMSKLLKGKLSKKNDVNEKNFDEKIIKCWGLIKFKHVFDTINQCSQDKK